MFVGTFQNGIRKEHFNESLAHMPAASLVGVVMQEEFYIKGGERNVEKKAQDAKEVITNTDNSRRNQYTSSMRDIIMFK